MQEYKGGDVARQAQELAYYHEPMPRLNGEGHHQQLSQDQSGERNGNDVDKLRLEQQHCSVHNDAPCGGKKNLQLYQVFINNFNNKSFCKIPLYCSHGGYVSGTNQFRYIKSVPLLSLF